MNNWANGFDPAVHINKLEATIAQQQARIEELKLALDKADPLDPSFLRYLELEQQLQAEREKSAALHQRFAEAVQAKERLERQLERHTRLLHMTVHNWALHSVVDCPEVECEEYRALLFPAPEEK